MGQGRGCSRLRARLRALRSALLLDGLPAGLCEDHWRTKRGILRSAEAINAILIVLVNPSLMASHGSRELLLTMYSPQRLLLVIALGAIQAYLIIWRGKWYDDHRNRFMIPLYLVRAVTYADAWAQFTRYRTIKLAAGDPERQFSYAIASATSFPLLMGNACHAVASFRGHLLVHSLITAAFLVYHQPLFVSLLRWAPCFDRALALQQWLQSGFAGLTFALVGTPPGSSAPQQDFAACPLLQLSLWLHLANAWLAPTYLIYVYFSSTQRSCLREQALTILSSSDSVAALEQQAEDYRDTAVPDGSGASCSSSSGQERGTSERTATATRRATGSRATASFTAPGSAQQAAVNHGRNPTLATSTLWPSDDVSEQQHRLLQQEMRRRYPAASQQELQQLSERMLAAVHQPCARASLLLRALAAVTWHVCVFGVLLVLLWMACTFIALVVHQIAVHTGYEWASVLCAATPTQDPLFADGFI